MPKPESVDVSVLKEIIRRIEHRAHHDTKRPPISFGIAAVDSALSWGGLTRAGLHEVVCAGVTGYGFHAGLLSCTAGNKGRILWCRNTGEERETGLPYGPGLKAFGLISEQFLFVRTRKTAEVLWAMEEGLRAGGLSAVIGEGITPDFTATRRLQLAAEASSTPAFLLPSYTMRSRASPLSAALTCWRIHALPNTDGSAAMRWRIDLVRCRGNAPKEWTVEWDEQALRFRLAEILADRATAAD